ncbi:hypothetical protein [Candidatus Sororendozoicomonas aggregata]|uniref:tetratricopeptide repeat protein n=1 Tax=Candidatus Sororendozoicomonas aggregata TaxID=3073239 RepID=UPI002ED57441
MSIKRLVLASALIMANPVLASSPAGTPADIEQAVASVKASKDNVQGAVSALEAYAKQGNGDALLWLGRIYRDGLGGTPKDPKRAFSCFERAAGNEGKNNAAKYELARAYYYGEGTDKNLIGAYIWATLSLRTPSGERKEAQTLVSELTGMLSEEQLNSAKIIAEQIHDLYLD